MKSCDFGIMSLVVGKVEVIKKSLLLPREPVKK